MQIKFRMSLVYALCIILGIQASNIFNIEVKASLVQNIRYIDIAAGVLYTAMLREDGVVYVLGSSSGGVFDVPKDLSCIKEISAGEMHIAALKEDGTVVAWGANSEGQ